MGNGFNPDKWGSEMKAISGGLNLGSEFNPEKLCSEMKGISAGLNWMRVPVQPRKVRFRDDIHQWGVEPRVWVQPRKVVLRDERYQRGVEPGCGFQFNPEKWGLEMKAINGGLNLVSEFNPEKLCSEMKGISAGLNWMRVPVQPRKVRFRDESHQWGVEPRVGVQPRKVVLRDERYQWGVEPGCGFQFNPEKWGLEMKAINGGLNLGSEFNPEKLCSEMKGISAGLNWMGVPVQPRWTLRGGHSSMECAMAQSSKGALASRPRCQTNHLPKVQWAWCPQSTHHQDGSRCRPLHGPGPCSSTQCVHSTEMEASKRCQQSGSSIASVCPWVWLRNYTQKKTNNNSDPILNDQKHLQWPEFCYLSWVTLQQSKALSICLGQSQWPRLQREEGRAERHGCQSPLWEDSLHAFPARPHQWGVCHF